MKKEILIACICCTLLGCEDVEKKASEKLQVACEAFERGDFGEAKTEIDSIKILYPKAFETRRKGMALMLQVELKEQEKTIDFLSKALHKKQEELSGIEHKFTFEKNEEYQTIGNYLHPSQVIEKNLHRSFLRFQANEMGQITMTSIYCGASNIHHNSIKVVAPDGTFAQTPPSKDSYETTDLGEKIEKADYKAADCENVVGFIYVNKDRNITVNYIGERPFSTTMTASDRQAAASIYQLSQVLSAITEIRKELDEANLKMEFVKRRIEESTHK